jgi:hypothetical protein
MSVSTAKRLPSLIRPIAMPATCAFSGTPASISARQPPHTEAIDDEPFDSVISETTRIEYGNSAAVGQHRDQRALGQAAVADLAALRRADAAGLAGGERRHVVVQHEVLAELAGQRVDRCESRSVPSVAATSACVSPRVNSAEPCTRGSTPLRISMLRTVRVSRPSMRGSPDRIWLRTILASMSNSTLSTLTLSNSAPFGGQRGETSAVTSRVAWVRACLERIW